MNQSELIVDSFAGGGGASLGIAWALGRGPDIAINHDSDAIAMHRVNQTRLRGAGAVVTFLRFGAWPVDGLVDPDRAAALAQRVNEQRLAQRRASEATHLIRHLRSQRWSEEQIEAELHKRGLEWP